MLLEDPSNHNFENEHLRLIFRYWQDKKTKRGGKLPGRSDIDPIEIAKLKKGILDDVWLLDVVPPKPRFRFRLIGGSLIAAGAPIAVGMYLDEADQQANSQSLSNELTLSCKVGLPAYRSGKPKLTYSRYTPWLERVSLPLASDGKTIDMFLCATHYTWQSS